MNIIDTTAKLQQFCSLWMEQEFITVDLEFMREHTYYANLCLIQIGSLTECAIIDPLAPGMELAPFFELMQNPRVVKVFHSGRQDIEIIHHLSGKIPAPLFDTQIAAMVCGLGEAISYEHLVNNLLEIELDKTSRLSDWSHRPLKPRQLAYALADVTHLVPIYQSLCQKLDQSGRRTWIDEEMAILSNPETYVVHPMEAWQRIKHRSHNPRFLTLLRELAAWREERSQRRNTPRQSFIRDETLLNIVAACPHNKEDLAAIRNLRADIASGKLGTEIIEVIDLFEKIPPETYVIPQREKNNGNGNSSLCELLKLLLKIKSAQEGVVARLIADEEDIRCFVAGKDKDCRFLKGWRRRIFGEQALALRRGELCITYNSQTLSIDLTEPGQPLKAEAQEDQPAL